MNKDSDSIAGQPVGAFGERAVEAELLRHGWLPANFNATVKNAAEFDISARKGSHQILVRVKACKPNSRKFQFGGFDPKQSIPIPNNDLDFTILVSMGSVRTEDEFYIVPTRIVREEIALRKRDYLKTAKRDGGVRKDTGHWTLHLASRRDDNIQGGYGLASKWAKYRENWQSLDKANNQT